MKTLTVTENIHGRHTEVIAKNTYQAASGEWIAEVDTKEMNRACRDLYRGLRECPIEELHIEAAEDDDGKEYRILTS